MGKTILMLLNSTWTVPFLPMILPIILIGVVYGVILKLIARKL